MARSAGAASLPRQRVRAGRLMSGRRTENDAERDDDEKEAIWLAGLPDDEGLLAALGRVAIIQSWVHYALRMWVGSLCDLSGQAALDATARQTFKGLRQRVRRLFAKRFGEGKPLCQLNALLRRAERATERRNTYHHAIWAVSPDGSEAALHHDEDLQWTAAPTTAQMKVSRRSWTKSSRRCIGSDFGRTASFTNSLTPKKRMASSQPLARLQPAPS